MRFIKLFSFAFVVAFFSIGASHADLISATPNLGVVTNATVKFFRSDGQTLLATRDTGSSGIVTADIGAYRGPVVVVVEGDGNAMYFDEAAGTLVRFPAGSKMFAIACTGVQTIAITPLTDIAYRQALAQNLFPLSCCEVRELNAIVANALARGLLSILSVPTTFDENTTGGSLQNNEAGRYAVLLAALARLGEGESSPALAVLKVLQQDAPDGRIDGRINGGRFVTRPPLYRNFTLALRREIKAVAADYGTPALKAFTRQNRLGPASANVNARGVKNRCRRDVPPPVTGGTGDTGGAGGGGF